MTSFAPRGAISRRRVVLDLLGVAEYDTVVPYDDLMHALDVDNIQSAQAAVNAAKPALEREHQRSLEAVPRTGYRILRPAEHLRLAQRHQKKSRRALTRASSTVTHVDLAGLTPGEQAAVTLAATSLSLQLQYMRRNDARLVRVETAAEVLRTNQTRSASEIAELRARLDILEGKKPE